jgi:cobalamin transport system substrate-binding protein
MNRKLVLAIGMLVLLMTACSQAPAATPVPPPTQPPAAMSTPFPPTATAATIMLTDGLSRVVALNGPAQRIVSLAPSNTEILFAIGAGAQVVGRDYFSDFPAEAKSVADIGGSMGKYNTEAIVTLHPDLVLAGEINPPELVASLQQLGLTVYFLKNPVTLEDMYVNVETVGRLTGHLREAVNLTSSFMTRLEALNAKLAGATSHPSVYYELDASDPTKPYTAGPGTFVDQLIQRAGGVNAFAQLKDRYAQISLEQLLVANPQVIILGDSAYGETPDKVAARPGWGDLTAVKKGQVYPFDDNLVSRPGPRLVDGLEALAKLLHPELFK